MPYIKEDKSKGIEESYIPDWIEQIKIEPFIPDMVPWLNEPQVNKDISIEGVIVKQIRAWTNISIDSSDPERPIINNTYTP